MWQKKENKLYSLALMAIVKLLEEENFCLDNLILSNNISVQTNRSLRREMFWMEEVDL